MRVPAHSNIRNSTGCSILTLTPCFSWKEDKSDVGWVMQLHSVFDTVTFFCFVSSPKCYDVRMTTRPAASHVDWNANFRRFYCVWKEEKMKKKGKTTVWNANSKQLLKIKTNKKYELNPNFGFRMSKTSACVKHSNFIDLTKVSNHYRKNRKILHIFCIFHQPLLLQSASALSLLV